MSGTIRRQHLRRDYLLDSTCREFVVENGKIDGKSELSVTVENDGTHLTIEKIDAESGKRISGAKLVLKDMDGNRVDSWISGGSGPHELEKLKPGSYVIVEEAAPDGYLAAEPVSFVLEAKQEVQTVKDLACETLTITKKIKADEITWAHGNPTFLFSVKGKDLYGKEHTYQCYLTFTKTQVEKTTDQDGYTEQSVQIGNSGRKRLPGTGEEGAAVFAYAGDRYEECCVKKLKGRHMERILRVFGYR